MHSTPFRSPTKILVSYGLAGPPVGLLVLFCMAVSSRGMTVPKSGFWSDLGASIIFSFAFGVVPALACGIAHVFGQKYQFSRARVLALVAVAGAVSAMAIFSLLITGLWIEWPARLLSFLAAATIPALGIGAYLTRRSTK